MTEPDGWRAETEKVRRSFDAVADRYRERFADELDSKPFDRELLDRLADRLRGRRVLEVGGGSGHIGDHLAQRGVDVVLSDISLGQLRQAPTTVKLACDFARLPVRARSLDAIVGFYCLIYGAAEHLDDVFADWHRALVPGGLAVIAVHAGEGFIHADEWFERAVDITVVFRDPDDVAARLERAGFDIEQRTLRPPYADEHPTDRLYVVAVVSDNMGALDDGDVGRAPICPYCGVTALPADPAHVIDVAFVCENPDCECFGESVES